MRPEDFEEDLDQELRAYLEHLTDEKIRGGMNRVEARRAALIEIGGMEQVKEECRKAHGLAWLDGLWQDVRYAVRNLRKNAGFTSVAVLSLALGIGANAAIFTVFYAVLVRPLPYKDPGELVAVGRGAPNTAEPFVLDPEFVAWRAGNHVFEGLTEWNDEQFNLTRAGNPEKIAGASVSADFLSVLGVEPSLGRSFTAEDDNANAPATALLTHDLWQRHFGGDPAAVGRVMALSDVLTTVVGVLPRSFRFPGDYAAEILIPSRLPKEPEWKAQKMGMLRGVGRLRKNVTPERAAAELADISSHYNVNEKGSIVQVEALQQRLVGNTRPVLLVLLGAVGLLLLIACVNVANLQLSRATVRRREIGLRAALGASRARLARLLVVENLILALLAGLTGFLAALAILDLLKLPSGLPLRNPQQIEAGWTLGLAAFALSTMAGLLVGIVPALTAPKLGLSEVLKSGSLAVIGGRGTGVRSVLVLIQVALSLILLLSSALLLRSLRSVLNIDLGFHAEGVLTAGLRLPDSRYHTPSQRLAFAQSLLARIHALPGVDRAATSNSLPLGGYSLGWAITVEGQPPAPPDKLPGAPFMLVTPEYFRVMGMRLDRGRPFTDQDNENAPPVVIVNSSFAKTFFPNGDAIGKYIRLGTNQPRLTIVGIVGDVRHRGPEKNAQAEVFQPEAQAPSHGLQLVIRTKGKPLSLASSVRSAVWSIDKEMPVFDLVTMEQRLSRSGAGRRVQTFFLTAFASLALCLAAVGIYGIVAEALNQRTREIGLRMALGAREPDVLRMVMKRSLMLAVAGIGIGELGSRYLTHFLATLLFGIQPTDVAASAAAGALLLGVALVAAYLPARRAARIDPAVVLRCE